MTNKPPKSVSQPVRPHPYHELTDKHTAALIDAFEGLPIVERIEFVIGIIGNRAERDGAPERELKAAYDILTAALNELRKIPGINEARYG